MVNGERTDSHPWFYGWPASSYTGAGANNFAEFLRVSGRDYPCIVEALSIGDVVQLVDEKGNAHHGMFVGGLDHRRRTADYRPIADRAQPHLAWAFFHWRYARRQG